MCSKRKRMVWWIKINIIEYKINDFTPTFSIVNSSYSSTILWGIVILKTGDLINAKIKHAVECIPKLPENKSSSSPIVKA